MAASQQLDDLHGDPPETRNDNPSAACPSDSGNVDVLSVSELTAQIKDSLEGAFPEVWVGGEISDLARPRSGHIYLTLKDEGAQLRAVMWRGSAARLRFELEDGLDVVCRGNIDVYPPRGSYQLVIRQVEPRGLGALQLALMQLQQRLADEGLFDPQHKQPLPRLPRRVAVVTSPTGAAIRDFLEVLARRWRQVDVLVIPTAVQGEGAAGKIAEGIHTANHLVPRPDVLVVTRGGGSLEDLWCFNDERVVRAIFASQVPVISAVGHEIDVTLADLVADVRALTPSEAAERIVPDATEVLTRLRSNEQRMVASMRARVADARARLEAILRTRSFRRPLDAIHDRERRLDELQLRAARAVQNQLEQTRHRVASLAGRLESLSPLSVLGRGFSLTQRADDGQLVHDAATVSPGEQIVTRLSRGRLISRVEQVEESTNSADDQITK